MPPPDVGGAEVETWSPPLELPPGSGSGAVVGEGVGVSEAASVARGVLMIGRRGEAVGVGSKTALSESEEPPGVGATRRTAQRATAENVSSNRSRIVRW
jgi:hypothetical protein